MLAPGYRVSPERVGKNKTWSVPTPSSTYAVLRMAAFQTPLNLVYSFYKSHTENRVLDHISRQAVGAQLKRASISVVT